MERSKKWGLLLTATLVFSLEAEAVTYNIHKGWNLLGAPCNIPASTFNKDGIVVVWKWVAGSWEGYSPDENINALIEAYGFQTFDEINALAGFWVYSNEELSINLSSCLVSNGTIDLNKGLIAYWSFDNCEAKDDSGNGHDGILYGNPTCVKGVKGEAFLFNGENQYISIPFKEDLNLEQYHEFTISVVAKADKSNGVYSVGFYETPNGAPTLISKDCIGDPTGPYNLYMGSCDHQNSTQCVSFEIQNNNNQIIEQDFDWPKVSAEEFHHIVWRHYENVYELWIDGVLKLKVHSDLEPVSGDNCLLIARRGWSNGFFKGIIDEVRIYNRALTEEEIKQLYAETVEY
ncbi:MAG: LamG domain-containing protein [Aquificae bacterium]|nr:LamG domain-containing protein [Aquificota bacterium]